MHKQPNCILSESEMNLELNGVQVPRGTYPAIQRNTAIARDSTHKVPQPVVVTVKIDGHLARALLDSSLLGDFLSSTLEHQLNVKHMKLNTPLALQLAVQGSHSKINSGAKVRFEYQNISEEHYLDIINLSNYDVILGMSCMYQHQACVGLNPPCVVIGCDDAKPINGSAVADLSLQAIFLENDDLEPTCVLLRKYAKPLCKTAGETELPPLRVINHMIPLIDENKVYQWCPSCCPEALCSQWVEK